MTAASPAQAVAAREARIARPWRVALALYAVALTAGTHWPRLVLGTDEFRVSDKIVHTAAFGALAVLLWQARLVRRPAALLAAGLAWALLDELTQGLPGLGRIVSWQDVLASSVGVFLAAAAVWAIEPVGGEASRRWHRRTMWSAEECLASGRAVLTMAGASLAVGTVGAGLGWAIFHAPRVERPMQGLLVGAMLGAAAGALGCVEVLRRRWIASAPRACFACGQVVDPSLRFDDEGRAACPVCGEALHARQWSALPPLRRLSALRLLAAVAVLAAAMVLMTFAVSLAMLALRLRIPWLASADAMYQDLGPDLRLILELAWVGALGAVTVRFLRRSFSRVVDHQHERCIACGFDLRGAPLEGGRGVCSECGAEFGR